MHSALTQLSLRSSMRSSWQRTCNAQAGENFQAQRNPRDIISIVFLDHLTCLCTMTTTFWDNKQQRCGWTAGSGTDIGATLGYPEYVPTNVTLPWAETVFIVLESWLQPFVLPVSRCFKPISVLLNYLCWGICLRCSLLAWRFFWNVKHL